jgi:hypothetical protein
MDYDRLIKLAKLANNNPNENEANLAARKVCKLLAEAEFVFTAYDGSGKRKAPVPPQQRQQPGTWSGFDRLDSGYQYDWEQYADFIKKARESRAREAKERETREQEARERARRTDEQYRKSYEEKQKQGYDPFSWFNSEFYNIRYDTEPRKQPKPKRPLACKTCGAVIEAAFVGPEVMFECFTCQCKK